MTPPFPFIAKSMKMVGARRSALETAHKRLFWIRFGFALVYVLMAIRVVDLTFVQGELQRVDQAGEPVQQAAARDEKPVRADITDRNGILLATSLKTASLYADPLLIREPEKVAQELVRVVPGLHYGEVLEKLQRRARFVWLKRSLTPAEQFEILQIGEPGLGFREEMRRIYPQGPLAAHLVGYTDVDGKGLGGAERSFNRLLADGGQPLRLSIDIRLQHILRREVQKAIGTFSAKGGAGVILDLATGEVLAGASLPDFDPHNVAGSEGALFNRLTLGVYELGSTFKIFSTAALLEFTNATLGTTFDAREPLKRGRFKITDYHAQKRIMNVPEVFIHSSNIGAALMGEAVGTKTLRDFYEDLGFSEPLPLEIPETGKPMFPRPWRDITTVTASYGHGIAVSPLQMVAAAASMVGDGTLIRPTLIAKGAAQMPQNDPDIRVISPQTAHRMRQLMRLAVTDGTGTSADVPGYRVGGKTGTAEQPGSGGYRRKHLISSFIGFFPMEAPRYAVFVMVDEPKGTKESYGYATGGWVAAPAVARVVKGMAAVLGIKPAPEGQEDLTKSLKRYVHDKAQTGDGVNFTPSPSEKEVDRLASY